MNKTVTLVNEWAAFEEKYPNASIDDFCRHRLIAESKKAQQEQGQLTGGVVPHISSGLLLKIMGRISKINMSYQNRAMAGTGITQLEEFGMLVNIKKEKNPRKTDVIYASLFELSSGSDMLKRLKARNLIREYDDENDKRSKRIELTEEGEKAVKACGPGVARVAHMLTSDLTEDDKQLCIQLLKSIEIKYSALWQQYKGKTIDEVFEELNAE